VTSLRVLLTDLVDYAGLFPPAGLTMRDAVAAYDSYRRGRWSWALGRFVVPASRLPEFSAAARHLFTAGDEAIPLRLAALLSPDAAVDLQRVLDFNRAHSDHGGAGHAAIDVVEARISSADDVAALAGSVPHGVSLVCEGPIDGDLDAWLRGVRQAGATAKARLGGVVPDAIPSSASVAVFLRACAERQVAFKLTAGLHHPVRGPQHLTYEPGSASATMHGFLNVFFAAVLARELAADPDAGPADIVVRILECEDAEAFAFDDGGARWRDRRIPIDALADARRHFALSFGSCSFEEPINDLRGLGWAT
jgi:hypothetical protein